METTTPLAVIVGSTRLGRFGDRVADWFVEQVDRRHDFEVDLIDLAKVELPATLGVETDGLAHYIERLDAADAFVIVTPEYNHGYPASLKQGIDVAFTQWQAKPVGFVSYGGMAGGLRAVEQLRQVLAELHAVTVRDCVSMHNPWTVFDEGSRPEVAAEEAAGVMLDELSWFARALREARTAEPYAA